MADSPAVKQTVKDSVFTDLFGMSKYLFQLYMVLHPEDTTAQEFFEGKQSAVEVTVKMIYDGKKGDIVNQYVTFTKVIDEQIKLYGRTKKAVQQAIQICKDADVLKEYLESRESEVVDIMMQLYDREEIMRVHDFNVARDASIMNIVAVLKDMGLSFSEIVEKVKVRFSLSEDRAKEEVEEYWNC